MSDINFYGLCRSLDLPADGYEDGLRELARYLKGAPGLKGHPAADACLALMNKIDNGYGFRMESVYMSGTLLILNSEAILIRILNLQRYSYQGGFSTWTPKPIDITRLGRILYCAQSGGTVFSVNPTYLGGQSMQVRLDSIYAVVLMYISCYAFYCADPQAFLANLRQCGANPEEVSDIETLAAAIKSKGLIPGTFPDGMESFARMLATVSAIFGSRSPVAITPKMIEDFCRARNNIAHRGRMLASPAYAKKMIRMAMIFMRCAITPAQVSVSGPLKDRVAYNLMNPIQAIAGPLGKVTFGLLAAFVVLVLIWTFTPTPLSERMYYRDVNTCGEREILFDAFARKDTAKVVQIHRDVRMILKAKKDAGIR